MPHPKYTTHSSSPPPHPNPRFHAGQRRSPEHSIPTRRDPTAHRPHHQHHRSRSHLLSFETEKPPSRRQTLILCIFRGPHLGFRSRSLTYTADRTTDAALWQAVRNTFRTELEAPWRRVFLFKTLVAIEPIIFSTNGVPRRRYGHPHRHLAEGEEGAPNAHQFMHAYRHPERLRRAREWVEWFDRFGGVEEGKSIGLEFVEGLWTEKLVVLGLAATAGIVVVCGVWCAKGGKLEVVFTVMGFVLSAFAAQIALIALYYQVSLPG